jgi:hypothetical protein
MPDLVECSELPSRLDLQRPGRVLLVDAPASVTELLRAARPAESETVEVAARYLATVKQTFDAILLWREDRVGSRAVMEQTVKRLAPDGALWIVTAMRKVMGPKTPAAHRLELSDLSKGLAHHGLANDREARITAWHVGYRFTPRT